MKKVMLSLALVSVLTMLLGSAAFAASPKANAATVINIDMCAPLIGGGTVCVTAKGMVKESATPSGNTNYVTNYREEINVIQDGQIITTYTKNEHFHALTMDGVLQELSERSRFTVTNFGQTFCVQYHIHGVNGADQFVRIDFC